MLAWWHIGSLQGVKTCRKSYPAASTQMDSISSFQYYGQAYSGCKVAGGDLRRRLFAASFAVAAASLCSRLSPSELSLKLTDLLGKSFLPEPPFMLSCA